MKGLLRAQINTDIFYTSFIRLSGKREVPSLSVSTIGIATVRMTTERAESGQTKIYYNVAVSDLVSGDELRTAGIYRGARGEVGEQYVPLCTSEADFNTNKYIMVDNSVSGSLTEEFSYINVTSNLYSTGVVRGQLRNEHVLPIFLARQ